MADDRPPNGAVALRHGEPAADHWPVLFEQLPVGVVVVGPDGTTLHANAAAEQLLGVTVREQRRRPLDSGEWSVVHPDGSPMPVAAYPVSRVLAGEDRVADVELAVHRPQGDLARLRVSAVAAPTGAGRGAVVVIEDVSHLREAMARGDRAQQVLALACDAADLALWRHTEEPGTGAGATVLEGGAALRRAGLLTDGRYLLTEALDRAADRGARRALAEAAASRRACRPYEVIFRVVGDDGERVWFLERGQPSPADPGSMLGATLDITEQAVSQELLESTERRVATVIEAAPDVISVASPTGELRYVSAAVENVLGVPADELIGARHEALVDPAVLADPGGHVGERAVSHRLRVRAADDSEVWLETTTRPVTAPGSEEVHEFVSITRDVTRQVRAYDELERLHAVAEEATRTKSRFLANMSHEIRTPMNAILGMAHLALHNETDAQQRRRLENIEDSASSLLAIINDILDHSKIEAGRLELEDVDFEIESVLERVRTLLGPRAADAEVGLLFDVDPDTPARLVGDPLRLGQVLTNLVSNAVKFTPAGGEVVLRVRVRDRETDRVELHVSVQDSGVGLSDEQLDRLFRPFTQADTSTTRAFGGTGLGLTICKDLVELMGGTIWAESSPEAGSTFHCRFAVEVAGEATVLGCLPRRDLPDLRALVVDDHRTAREIFATMLRGFGLRVEEARDGAEALEVVADAAAGDDPFGLVLVDWQMPGLDGVEVLRRVQATGPSEARPATILVTAFDAGAAQRSARGVAVDAFVEKPATPSALFDVLMDVVTCPGEVRPSAPSSRGRRVVTPPGLVGARVLVVEDNVMNQQLAVELLTMYGLQPTVASNGAEALDLLTEGAPVDGVLMDCQMPVMDGYEATRRIREVLGLEELPIIAMTANAMRDDVERAHAAGMDDHVAKPIDVEVLLATLADRIVAGAPPDAAPPPGPSAPSEQPEQPEQPELPEVPGLDTAAGLTVTAGNVELYLHLIELFLETNATFLADFEEARRGDDPVAPTRIAHTLAGTAAGIGAAVVATAARSLESACERHDEVAVAYWARQTQACLERLLPALGTVLADGDADAAVDDVAVSRPGSSLEADVDELLGCIEEQLAESDPTVAELVPGLQQSLAGRSACVDPVRSLAAAVRVYDFEAAARAVEVLRSVLEDAA